ncbi:ABC transporter ATP-binding protein [Xylanibacter brevis]|uniref:ABC transporter ATP-binding protein n=1 Tax=Xylanibacter brevis TaxID=83231 RepID=UPI0004877F8F|nr:ABC transporter ATP-binding protein [Xylanibacter brevis]
MSNISVQLRQLSIGYKQKHQQKLVAQGIDATIAEGQLTCLLGANGIGKSTLLRTLAAFQPPLQGEILLDGKPLGHYSDSQLSRRVGVVLTEKPHIRNMSVSELVGLGRAPYTGFWGRLNHEDRTIVNESLSQVGIQSLAHRMVDTLSDGERQKVMIAKALAQQTPIIYLDEPTAFLDFPSKVEMMQLLRRLAHQMQKTVFLSTHDFELALQVADVLWLMEPQSLHIGTARQLADSGVLSRFVEREGIAFDVNTLRVQI